MPGLMLVDGNSLTYRAFFALPADMATASGQVTNAVFGFTSMLINLMRDHRPDQVAVCFDRPEPTFRHAQLDTYKANRTAAPDILKQQVGLVRQVIETLGIPILDLAGYEADDLIATLATQAAAEGMQVLVVTGDRDSYQLVEDPLVKVLYNRRGVSDYALYDEAGIEERTGVPPRLYLDYAALRGDTSDNLPGVPGVGEKTAAKLITMYGGIDGVFENLDAQTPKLRQNLAASEALVRQNVDIMRLVRDVPLDVGPRGLVMKERDPEELRRLFDFLEFRTLVDRLNEALALLGTGPVAASGDLAVLEAEVRPLETAADAVELLGALASVPGPVVLAGSWPRDRERAALEGVALVADADTGEVAWLPAALLESPEVVAALAGLVGPGGRPVAGHGVKGLLRALLGLRVDVAAVHLDTRIAAYLLDPAESRYLLAELLPRYALVELPADEPEASGQLAFEGEGVGPARRTARHALGAARLVAPLEAQLEELGLRQLNDEVEVPLVLVLARMEHTGVAVDRDELERLNRELGAEAAELTKAVWEAAGHEFNVNSTLQLRQVLYDELGLTPQKRTKTGYSTDAATLEKLQGQHPIVDHLLRYREVEKLRGTYGDGLLAEVAPDGRIHATFQQTVARTGRLSSEEPNLHNIPVRSELGREFRKAFVASPGHELCVADYNQIELRCIAHLAEDPGLIEAFEARRDIHNTTAARVFGVEPAAVTIEMRSKAKMVSYGLAYGMEAFGLAQRLNIPTPEAVEILDAYFVAFPAVKAYMERTVVEARKKGYTETLYGRRRYIPELTSSNWRVRQAGERQAMNAGIQGLAADIFKVALVRLDLALRDRALRSCVVLQVHDEVILEVPPEEHEAAAQLVPEIMSRAFVLDVPLEVNLAFGPTWADAKG
ncbi:MAG: DNA polymerase I [Acidimicrobiia bacterium]|nr:DNA polymerase I [Acidimicrobiia bacterium]